MANAQRSSALRPRPIDAPERSTRRDVRRLLAALRRHVGRWHESPGRRFEDLLDEVVEHVAADRATLLVRARPDGFFREIDVRTCDLPYSATTTAIEPARSTALDLAFGDGPRSAADLEPLLSGYFQVRCTRGALLVQLPDADADIVLQLESLEGEGHFRGGLGLVDQACQLLSADLRAANAGPPGQWWDRLRTLGERVRAAGMTFEVDCNGLVGDFAPTSDLALRSTEALLDDVLRLDEARHVVVVLSADERSTLIEIDCDDEGGGAPERHLLLRTRLAAVGGHLRIGDERRCRPRHAYIPNVRGA